MTALSSPQPAQLRRDRLIDWPTAGTVSAAVPFRVFNSVFNERFPLPDSSEGAFTHLGLPRHFKVELSIANTLGLVALLAPTVPSKSKVLAYFGCGITLVSACMAHAALGDRQTEFRYLLGRPLLAVIPLILLNYLMRLRRLQ